MFRDRHEVFLYAPESNPVSGVTLVECLSETERIKTFGPDDDNLLPSWPTDAQSLQFNLNAAAKIAERIQEHDLVLLSGGLTHLPIQKALAGRLCVESGVGYEGVIGGGVFAAYESDAWRHYVAALRGFKDIRWFDRTIPNYFDEDDFPVLNDGNGEFLLAYGRAIARKGHHIALDIAKAAGLPLVAAGAGWQPQGIEAPTTISGVTVHKAAKLVGQDVTLAGDNLFYVGPVNVEQRAKLLAAAKAIMVCTTYLEPFGGVSVEANFCGTPAICSAWGAFTETVETGLTGYRFSTLREGVEAVKSLERLSHHQIKGRAIERFSLPAVAKKFDNWFRDLESLFNRGWYEI